MKFLHLPSYSVFDYKPRFYDSEKEERKNQLNDLRTSLGKDSVDIDQENQYIPGSTIKGRFRSKISTHKKSNSYFIRLLLIIVFICFAIYLIMYTRVGHLLDLL